MSYATAIEELQQEISEERKSVAEKELVLATLLRLEQKRKASGAGVIDRLTPVSDMPAIIPVSPKTRTLAGSLRDAIFKLNGAEFSVPLLEKMLIDSGFIMHSKHPRARISTELATLVKRNEIFRTFEGTGGTPHRYKQVTTTEAPAGTAQNENNV